MVDKVKNKVGGEKLNPFAEPIVFLLGIILTLVILLGVWALDAVKTQVMNEKKTSLQTVLNTSKDAVDLWVKERLEETFEAADNPQVKDLTIARLKTFSENKKISTAVHNDLTTLLLPDIKKNQYFGFSLIAPDLSVLASHQKENGEEITLLGNQTNFLYRVLQGETAVVLDAWSSDMNPSGTERPAEKMSAMFVGSPIKDEQSQIVAALILQVNPERNFTRFLMLGRLGETGETYAFNKRGLLMSNSRFDVHLRKIGLISKNQSGAFNVEIRNPGKDMTRGFKSKLPRHLQPFTLMAQSATSGESGFNVEGYRDYRGVPVIGAWAWLENLEMGLTTEIDLEEAYSSFNHIKRLFIFVFFIMALLFLAFSATLYFRRKKIIEEERKVSKLLTAVEQSPSSIVITDIQGNIEYVNPMFTQITQYKSREVLGKNSRILKSGVHPSNFYRKLWETILSGEIWKGEILNKRKDGALFWESTAIAPLKNNRDEITHFVAIKENITEKKLLLDELKHLSLAVEQSLSPIFITNTKGIIEFVNNAFLESTGYTKEEVIGKTPRILKSGKHTRNYYKNLWQTLLAGETWKHEICNKKKNGELFWEYQCISPIKNADGEIKRFLSVKLDDTQRKNDEEKLKKYAEDLEKSNRELEEFAFIASHDLQEPLRKIVAFGDRLKNRLSEIDHESADYLQRMQKSSHRMQLLIDDLLEYSRLDKTAKSMKKIDMKEVINEAMENLETRINASHARIDLGPLPVIEADEMQMKQLFQNLLGNSLKYHRENVEPEIEIGIESQDEKSVSFFIKDNGIGFDEKYSQRIFKLFERLHGKGQFSGTGIGLAICKKIIDHHHGEIRVRSQEGQGSTFTLILPKKQVGNDAKLNYPVV